MSSLSKLESANDEGDRGSPLISSAATRSGPILATGPLLMGELIVP